MNPPSSPAWVVLNGAALPAAEARVSPLGDGFMFGVGVFTTLKVLDGAPVFFREHHARLGRDAAALGLAAPDAAELRARVQLCLDRNGPGVRALKIVRFQDVAGAGELIVPRPFSFPPEFHERGARLRSLRPEADAGRALAAHKTINYLAHLRARRDAQADGLDDALWIAGDGTVLESASSNIFAVCGGEIVTTATDDALLPGVARQIVLWLRPSAREQKLTRALLAAADEVFLTNSLIGVLPVAAIDERRYDVTRNPVTRALAAAFADAERASR